MPQSIKITDFVCHIVIKGYFCFVLWIMADYLVQLSWKGKVGEVAAKRAWKGNTKVFYIFPL